MTCQLGTLKGWAQAHHALQTNAYYYHLTFASWAIYRGRNKRVFLKLRENRLRTSSLINSEKTAILK